MNRIFSVVFLCLVSLPVVAQVDVAHRRVLGLQSSAAVSQSEERPLVFPYFWFNENQYPWTNTALRAIFAGIYGDAELSYFLPANTNIALGVGAGGGAYIAGVTPYDRGERLSQQCFYGDTVGGRIFINETFSNPTPLPLNVRATYGVSGYCYRESDGTRNFVLPEDFLLQTLQVELRLGGMEPGMLARRGVQLYVGADANYRSGYRNFGPVGGLFPGHSEYQRAYATISGRLPVGPVLLAGRLSGGMGQHLDQLSAYKLGGHFSGIEDFSYMLHGYYTRELFADDFGLANLTLTVPLLERWDLAGHVYGDWAAAKLIDVNTGRAEDWHNFFGVGAGVSFRACWNTRALITYGYGINAVRNGDHGGHEIGLALEKKF